MSVATKKEQVVLDVSDLSVAFDIEGKSSTVVDNASFRIHQGETLALVGESGCGKSVTASAVMGLIESPGRITDGNVSLQGQELIGLSESALQDVRGKRIGMIFQEPMVALNPLFTVGDQIAEVLLCHTQLDRVAVDQKCLELLDQVGIPDPNKRLHQYPHEMSGGMKQRVMIAMAIACKPALLIADEPTTALDVTVQAQILGLIGQLQKDMNMAVLLITHNLGIVAQHADRVIVMYAGRITESAPVKDLFAKPAHPYTQGLLKSIPRVDGATTRLYSIEGTVPSPDRFPTGCRFSNRCPIVMNQCRQFSPAMTQRQNHHYAACWNE